MRHADCFFSKQALEYRSLHKGNMLIYSKRQVGVDFGMAYLSGVVVERVRRFSTHAAWNQRICIMIDDVVRISNDFPQDSSPALTDWECGEFIGLRGRWGAG